MEYRINRKTGDKISVLGMGTSAIAMAEEKEAAKTLEKAFEEGINYYDMATSHGSCFQVFGKVMRDVREKIFYQIHFGADYTKGAYGWTTDLETVKRSVDWQLEALKTDYIDYGFLHCLDEEADWKQHKEGGILQYLLRLREQGVVRHLGLSSHTPATAELVLDTGLPDMLMLSINPAYDYECGDEWGKGNVSERMRLYQRCETEGGRDLCDESLQRRAAAGCKDISFWKGAYCLPVHPVYPGQAGSPNRASRGKRPCRFGISPGIFPRRGKRERLRCDQFLCTEKRRG